MRLYFSLALVWACAGIFLLTFWLALKEESIFSGNDHFHVPWPSPEILPSPDPSPPAATPSSCPCLLHPTSFTTTNITRPIILMIGKSWAGEKDLLAAVSGIQSRNEYFSCAPDFKEYSLFFANPDQTSETVILALKRYVVVVVVGWGDVSRREDTPWLDRMEALLRTPHQTWALLYMECFNNQYVAPNVIHRFNKTVGVFWGSDVRLPAYGPPMKDVVFLSAKEEKVPFSKKIPEAVSVISSCTRAQNRMEYISRLQTVFPVKLYGSCMPYSPHVAWMMRGRSQPVKLMTLTSLEPSTQLPTIFLSLSLSVSLSSHTTHKHTISRALLCDILTRRATLTLPAWQPASACMHTTLLRTRK